MPPARHSHDPLSARKRSPGERYEGDHEIGRRLKGMLGHCWADRMGSIGAPVPVELTTGCLRW